MIHTTGDLARRYGVPIWLVRQIIDRGEFPTLRRIGPYRTITDEDIPTFEANLGKVGQTREALAC